MGNVAERLRLYNPPPPEAHEILDPAAPSPTEHRAPAARLRRRTKAYPDAPLSVCVPLPSGRSLLVRVSRRQLLKAVTRARRRGVRTIPLTCCWGGLIVG